MRSFICRLFIFNLLTVKTTYQIGLLIIEASDAIPLDIEVHTVGSIQPHFHCWSSNRFDSTHLSWVVQLITFVLDV